MRRARRQRGTTLTEILISIGVVLVGMAGLFRTLATSVTGATATARQSQAQQRAVAVLELIRTARREVLDCLAAREADAWRGCAPGWDAALPPAGARRYALVARRRDGGPTSRVARSGDGGHVYDAQVVVGWNDGGGDPARDPEHSLTLRSGVFWP